MSQWNGLAPLDFGLLLSSPLTALVDAQAQAARATLDFVRSVGLEGDRLRMASIDLESFAEDAGTGRRENPAKLTVPALSLMNVPSLRITEASIEFCAKVIAIDGATRRGAESLETTPPRLRTLLVHRRRSHRGDETMSRFTMQVKLKVASDELPPGIERLIHEPLSESSGR
jgi:hypothetical protein